MMLPALLYLLINNYIPMAGMVIAFKKLNFAKGIWASPWAGLKKLQVPVCFQGCMDHYKKHVAV